MKIVLDCNVIISAAITDGTCRQAIKEAVLHHQIYVSEEIMLEIKTVSERAKFKKFYPSIIEILEIIFRHASLVKDGKAHNHKLPDPQDEIYLTAALSAKCDYIVTGNSKDFPEKKYEKVKIVSPREFLNLFYH